MSDAPPKWTAHDAPPGIAELVRSLDRPPALPPEIRASVRRGIVRRISPMRWIGPTSVAAVVVAGITLWILGPKFPTGDGERREIVAARDPIADAGFVDARTAPHVRSLTPEEAVITPEMRHQLAALGYAGAPSSVDAGRSAPGHPHPTRDGAPAAGDSGALNVNTMPWSHLFLDGRDTGQSTPVVRLPVAPGRHTLDLVTSDGVHHAAVVDVGAGETVRVIRRFDTTEEPEPHQPLAPPQTGTLRINSTPWSRVYVDGRLVGNTPIVGLELSAGRHRVTLVNDSLPAEQTIAVNVTAGQVQTQNVRLSPSATRAAPDNPF